MARSMSLSAFDVRLELYELEALIEWHRDRQWQLADKQEYREAADHQDRAADLIQQLNDREGALAALAQRQGEHE